MDTDRINRIARALCRAARLDPDEPVAAAEREPGRVDADTAQEPPAAWTLFREAAEAFVARHGDRVVARQ